MDQRTGSSDRIEAARKAAGLSQRQLAEMAGIAQATLSRIEQDIRPAKMNEILALAWALGCPASELMACSGVRDRLECVARATEQSGMETMRGELGHYLELDAYLEDQGIAPQL
ncbi:helix-turn-helix domain-containing protein [Kribbella sp. CA-293567]|uniref:helix-turn-helix domain-containing protein n=1 Tax=Kribbella sp. CA-293567 TaxID=3002436 RepID=UPI0022DCF397|nr:helix-turn-helix transcriptional regulator [Kribbella sp. CA-293567]WBQ06262.1 helix-turn-helix transcriptional regulator [Kribbella sp. CA-293567]